jgi:hypothetical protein
VDGTDDSYLSKSMNFVEYVLEACPLVQFDRFSEGYRALSPVAKGKRSKKGVIGRREYLKQFVDGIDASRLAETGVINVELITENIVGEWLAGFKGKNETTPSKSVYGMAQLLICSRNTVPYFRKRFTTQSKTFKMGRSVRARKRRLMGVFQWRKGRLPFQVICI